MKRISGGQLSLGANATLLSSHAGGPRAAAGDTSFAGQAKQSTEASRVSPPPAREPTGQVGRHRPDPKDDDSERRLPSLRPGYRDSSERARTPALLGRSPSRGTQQPSRQSATPRLTVLELGSRPLVLAAPVLVADRRSARRRLDRGHGVVVDRELLDVGRLGEREVTEVCDGWHEAMLNELIEFCAGVPEVNYAPAPVDRARRVEDQPAGWPVLDIEVVVDCDVLLLGTAGELQPESDGHHGPFVGGVGEHIRTARSRR